MIQVVKRIEEKPKIEKGYYPVDKTKPVKLDLGSGLNQMPEEDGWIHQDSHEAKGIEIVSDWKNIPLESGVVDIIRLGDVIEHIKPWEIDIVMKEWNRIMKIGCKCHLTTPNFLYSCQEFYLGKMDYNTAQQNLYGDRANFECTHYLTYTFESLKEILEKYGFGEIDFSESPGMSETSTAWWIVANFIKIKNI
jgi:predicted SAM-dependent methyltransferase